MHPFRFLSASLILIALGNVTPICAAAENAAATTKAAELMRQRNPKQTIPRLIEIIETNRDNLNESTDALVQLVACFQLLRGDAAAEAQYREVSAKYLSAPPPLDGKTLPTVDQVSEDLLWKSWVAGQEERFAFTTGQVMRTNTLPTQDGAATSQLTVDIPIVDTELQQQNAAKIAELTKHLGKARGMQAMQVRAEIETLRAKSTPARLSIANDDETSITASARSGEHVLKGTAYFMDGTINVTFDNVPGGLQRLDDLNLKLTLTQPRNMQDTLVPLNKGATWKSDDATGTMSEVTIKGNDVQVRLELVSAGNGRGRNVSSSSASMTVGGMMEAMGGASESDAPICLVTAEGLLVTPKSQSISSINNRTTMNLSFHAPGKAEHLRFRKPTAVSERTIPVQLTGIILP